MEHQKQVTLTLSEVAVILDCLWERLLENRKRDISDHDSRTQILFDIKRKLIEGKEVTPR